MKMEVFCKCGCRKKIQGNKIYIHGHNSKGRKHSKNTRKKMSMSHKGKKLTEKHKENIRHGMNNPIIKYKVGIANRGKNLSIEHKKKIAESTKGKKISKECREKISKANILAYKNLKSRKKLSNALKGRKLSIEWKQKLRLAKIKYIEKCLNNGESITPTLGTYESEILNSIEKSNNIKIIRQYKSRGYFLDGYCKKLNIAIEIDEPHHFKKEQAEKDKIRQQEIEKYLGCQFIRIEG